MSTNLARLRAGIEEAMNAQVLELEEIPAGLGLRSFFRARLEGSPASVIARVETVEEDAAGRPPGVPPEPPLEPIRALLEARGLPVPARFGPARQDDLVLLEDLGGTTLEQCFHEDPQAARACYEQVVGDLPLLQATPATPGVAAFERQLDSPLFAYKAELFCQWSLPAALGRPGTSAECQAVRDGFAWIAAHMARAPARLAHRDLMSRNLLVQGGRVRWIDLQGAFLAPPEYDLVCLLRDSYVELPDAWTDELLERVRPSLPDAPAADAFRERFELLTLTRKGKDHARFHYAHATRAGTGHLASVPATVRHLHRAAHACAGLSAELAALAELVLALPLPDTPGSPESPGSPR